MKSKKSAEHESAKSAKRGKGAKQQGRQGRHAGRAGQQGHAVPPSTKPNAEGAVYAPSVKDPTLFRKMLGERLQRLVFLPADKTPQELIQETKLAVERREVVLQVMQLEIMQFDVIRRAEVKFKMYEAMDTILNVFTNQEKMDGQTYMQSLAAAYAIIADRVLSLGGEPTSIVENREGSNRDPAEIAKQIQDKLRKLNLVEVKKGGKVVDLLPAKTSTKNGDHAESNGD